MKELQNSLAEEQADYAYDVQIESLDKQQKAFEDAKDDEIEALEDMLSSTEKLLWQNCLLPN